MKNTSYFFLLSTALFLFSCSTPEAPEFQRLENVRFKSASITNLMNFTLTANAVFNNPHPVGATITALDLEMFVNGEKVSDIKQNVSAPISGNSDFKLPLEIEVPLTKVLKDIKPTLGELFKKREISYQLKGTATVSVAGVEVNIPVDYEDKEELKL